MSKCFFLGVARNCGVDIPDVFKNIRKMSDCFIDFHIFIAYDVSNDDTLKKLLQQKNMPQFRNKLTIFHGQRPLSHVRTQNISNARNHVFEAALEHRKERGWDYFVVLDLDGVCGGDLDIEVFKTCLNDDRWDCLSFNRDAYYDAWALSYPPYTVSCWNYGEQSAAIADNMCKDITHKLSLLDNSELFECDSAFNGIAIYRFEKFVDSRYDWKTSNFVNIDHIQAQIVSREHGDDCEHRAFHQKAKFYGAKIFISPLILIHDYKTVALIN
jgi:hypothetical protein